MIRARGPTATLPLPVTLTLYFLKTTLGRLLGTAKIGILKRVLFVTKSFQLHLLPYQWTVSSCTKYDFNETCAFEQGHWLMQHTTNVSSIYFIIWLPVHDCQTQKTMPNNKKIPIFSKPYQKILRKNLHSLSRWYLQDKNVVIICLWRASKHFHSYFHLAVKCLLMSGNVCDATLKALY